MAETKAKDSYFVAVLKELDATVRRSALGAEEVAALTAAASNLLRGLETRLEGDEATGLSHSVMRHLNAQDEFGLIVGLLSSTDAYFLALSCRRLRDAVFHRFTGDMTGLELLPGSARGPLLLMPEARRTQATLSNQATLPGERSLSIRRNALL